MPRAKRKRSTSVDKTTAKKSKVDTEDLSKLTVAKLKVQLKKYDLDVKGKKAILIKRLQEHLDTNKQSEEATPAKKSPVKLSVLVFKFESLERA